MGSLFFLLVHNFCLASPHTGNVAIQGIIMNYETFVAARVKLLAKLFFIGSAHPLFMVTTADLVSLDRKYPSFAERMEDEKHGIHY